MKLTLKEYIHNNELSLKEFLYNFLVIENNNRDTLDEDGNIQTSRCRSRSLGDITCIVNSYYPETSMEVIKETLLSFGNKLVGHYCHTINKRVYTHKDDKTMWEQCNTGELDEYGNKIDYLTHDE